jgi:hypothetical protein
MNVTALSFLSDDQKKTIEAEWKQSGFLPSASKTISSNPGDWFVG